MNILALSGSLRRASINTMLLRAIARIAPEDVGVTIFAGLGELPLFNPDLDLQLPASVVAFHRAVSAADAVLFASPEYAHGVTGTIKNALDWLVGFEPFANKIVAVLNTSPRAQHADAALRETLRTMAAVIVESASISIPLLGAGMDEAAVVTTPAIADAIREALWALKQSVVSRQATATAEFSLK